MEGGTERLGGRLALAFQEAFTVVVRLRDDRQVAADGDAFRRHVKQVLVAADREARDAGYDPELVRLAVYAYIAFLDESVLNSPRSMFSDWPRQPLQVEVFGDQRAGETFYEQLRDLLGRQDSGQVADVLEVYLLCLLLGFRGRYGSAESGEVHSLMSRIRTKIDRVRGDVGELSPSWALPAAEEAPTLRDPWIRRLAFAAGGTLGLAVLLFGAFSLALGSGVDGTREVVQRILAAG